uniref:Formylglycine-generating enzyme, required for sulfatase activity, contains SUMF1/FGE domain n=1 Tax=Candidatus Kentrum sp. TUN TaxID=2126343 RepID=A0A451A8V9_9GAMM|nr:MAG: Formylglycine-generating enzyme, required for sulfatase activity, contains SUMF1/FGE domain [Candidatus Kentron sp. TUN]
MKIDTDPTLIKDSQEIHMDIDNLNETKYLLNWKNWKKYMVVLVVLLVIVGMGAYYIFHIPPPPQSAELVVHANVSGGSVYVDDEAVGETGPTVHNLTPDKHRIRVEKVDYEPFEIQITLVAGERQIVNAWLNSVNEPILPGVEEELGELLVNLNIPGGMLYIDGKPKGPIGDTPHTLSPGENEIRIEKVGYEPFRTRITSVAGERQVINAWLNPVSSRLIVRSNVSGATVYIDGEAVGPAGPEAYSLPVGRHQIRVKKKGYSPYETWITLTAGEKQRVVMARLEPVSSSQLIVKSNVSGAMVFIDGKLVGPASPKAHDLPLGKYRVRVEKEGYSPFKARIALTPREPLVINAQLYPVSPPPRPRQLPRLIVRSNVSGDIVSIDGKPVGPTGPEVHSLAVGKHRVRVEKKGYRSFATEIILTEGEKKTIYASLGPELPPPGCRNRSKGGGKEPKMITIPIGEFLMGSPENESGRYSDEDPQHLVRITKSFTLGITEVTFKDYDRFACATRRKLPDDGGWGRGKRPVINVDWNDAMEYAKWLSRETGKRYRLPSEVEWEYAARAGSTTRYFWGDDEKSICAYANGYDVSAKRAHKYFPRNNPPCDDRQANTAPVGSYRANPFGLSDMSGNVWEWTADCWHDNYRDAPADSAVWGRENRGNCSRRVIRGGAWHSQAADLRSADRSKLITGGAINSVGFRLAGDL